jgi:hypothetical protein
MAIAQSWSGSRIPVFAASMIRWAMIVVIGSVRPLGAPPKSLGFDRAMGLRKFCEKFLEPTRGRWTSACCRSSLTCVVQLREVAAK